MTKLESKNLIEAVSELAKLNADVENADNVLCDANNAFLKAERAKDDADVICQNAKQTYDYAVTKTMDAQAIVTDMINDLI